MASTEAAAKPVAPPAKARAMPSARTITWLTMCFMTVSAVASIRNTPSMAVYGLACIFLYLLPAVVFLLPTSLVAAELASGWDGGVYNWVTQGIGPRAGFIAIWTQFAMTLTYYPSLLAYVASTLAYVIYPPLANNGVYTAAVIVIVYWVSTMVSMRGVGLVAKLSSSSMLLGTAIPGAALVILGVIYLLQGNQSAAPIEASALIPQVAGLAGLVLIVNNFLSYAGMEVNAVHVKSMKDPGKEFPKAMFVAMPIVIAIFVLPALAISWVVPSSELTLTGGVMQAFTAFFDHFDVALAHADPRHHAHHRVAGRHDGVAGRPVQGPAADRAQRGLPAAVLPEGQPGGIQVNILFAQGIIVTVIALLFALIPNVSSVYWIFSVITTQVYLIMYFLMFISAMRLRKSQPDHPRGYRAPILPVLAIVGLDQRRAARSPSASCRRRSSAAAVPRCTCSSSAAGCSSSAC